MPPRCGPLLPRGWRPHGDTGFHKLIAGRAKLSSVLEDGMVRTGLVPGVIAGPARVGQGAIIATRQGERWRKHQNP